MDRVDAGGDELAHLLGDLGPDRQAGVVRVKVT
jgi:hypothetical protein